MTDARQSTGARSPQDWGRLFDAHHNSIWRYLCRRVGPTAADDLAGEVFLRALRSTVPPAPGEERAWLYGVATNLMREHARRERRYLRAYARLSPPDAEPLDTHGVAERLDAVAQMPALVAELIQLTPADRDTLLLYALTELNYDGIAVATGVPVGTVRSRLNRVRRRLRETLGDIHCDATETALPETRSA